jgi:hypothetical protein
MKRTHLRIFPLVGLILGFAFVSTAYARSDNETKFTGVVESLPSTAGFIGDWRISGRTVHVTAATVIDQEHAPVAVGASVEIKGTIRADGSIDATKIETKSASSNSSEEGQSAKVNGAIQSLPTSSNLIGDWMIDDRIMHVTSSTKLKGEHGPFAVGTRVKVKGLKFADGSVVATKIQVTDSN